MSTLQISILLGVLVWLGLCVVIVALFKGGQSGADKELDDMEQIAAVSQPAPLEQPRPRIRAIGSDQ